jgi:hypothetical protein
MTEREYNPDAQSLDNVYSWDDVVSPAEKEKIRSLALENPVKPVCKHLGRKGDYFCFCRARAEDIATPENPLGDRVPRALSPEYIAVIEVAPLELFCVGSVIPHSLCIYYR